MDEVNAAEPASFSFVLERTQGVFPIESDSHHVRLCDLLLPSIDPAVRQGIIDPYLQDLWTEMHAGSGFIDRSASNSEGEPLGLAKSQYPGSQWMSMQTLHVSAPKLAALLDFIQQAYALYFNHIKVTQYSQPEDNIADHSDDMQDIVPGTPIFSISLGDSHELHLRSKHSTDDPIVCVLRPGDVFMLGPITNSLFQHSVPPVALEKEIERENGAFGPRISIVCRHVNTIVSREEMPSKVSASIEKSKVRDAAEVASKKKEQNKSQAAQHGAPDKQSSVPSAGRVDSGTAEAVTIPLAGASPAVEAGTVHSEKPAALEDAESASAEEKTSTVCVQVDNAGAAVADASMLNSRAHAAPVLHDRPSSLSSDDSDHGPAHRRRYADFATTDAAAVAPARRRRHIKESSGEDEAGRMDESEADRDDGNKDGEEEPLDENQNVDEADGFDEGEDEGWIDGEAEHDAHWQKKREDVIAMRRAREAKDERLRRERQRRRAIEQPVSMFQDEDENNHAQEDNTKEYEEAQAIKPSRAAVCPTPDRLSEALARLLSGGSTFDQAVSLFPAGSPEVAQLEQAVLKQIEKVIERLSSEARVLAARRAGSPLPPAQDGGVESEVIRRLLIIPQEQVVQQSVRFVKALCGREKRISLAGRKPFVIIAAGPPGGGKTTFINVIDFVLHAQPDRLHAGTPVEVASHRVVSFNMTEQVAAEGSSILKILAAAIKRLKPTDRILILAFDELQAAQWNALKCIKELMNKGYFELSVGSGQKSTLR